MRSFTNESRSDAEITEIEEIEYAPNMTFYIQYDEANVPDDEVWEANNNTNDDLAENVGTGSGGSATVPSYWEDVDTTYTFFIGDQDGTHCQWQGIYVTE